MTQWSKQEAERTVEEVRRRSMIDPEFRALALSDAKAAVAKVNPKSLPEDISIRFVEDQKNGEVFVNAGPEKTIVLPDPVARIEELSDLELDQVAGGEGAPISVRTP